MNRTKTLTAVAVTALALAAAGCGGDDDEGETTAATGATGLSSGDTSADYEITVEEFILATNKQEILDNYMANEENNCSDVDDDFVLTASAAATNLSPDAPLEDVIVDICGEP
jgi:hypothetical protein